MKIAFLSFYYGGSNRGAESFVSELSSRLKENNSVEILSGNSQKLMNWPILWRFFLDPQGIGVLMFTFRNISKIWANKYDIVIPMDGGWEALLVRILTWLYGGKVVISGQSGKGWFDRINILSFPNIFISLSTWTLQQLKWMNPFINFEYIPNGVDLNKFEKSDRSQNIILSVGAFTKEKGHRFTIDAVSKLKNIKLIVIGSGGNLKDEIEKYGREKLGNLFEIKTVAYNDRYKEFERASVFAFPTVPWESFGIVLVEAMASGLPVVATNDPIRREIIGNAGILVDPTNIEEYSKALDNALNINWGDKPRKQAEKFSWDNIANQYEDLFKSLSK